MCGNCNKKSCGGCSKKSSGQDAQIEAILAELQDQIDTLIENTKVFACGHPILLIENADDIAQFNSAGAGFGCWEKWAICDGKTHINPITKKPFVTPNFTDRFIVQARGAYAVDDVGGEARVTLITTELPIHNHGVTDPGHIHDINDPGHIHPIQDDMHVHQGISTPHRHSGSGLSIGSHTHNVTDHYQDDARLGAIGAGPSAVSLFLNNDPDIAGSVTIASANETFDTETTDGGSGGSVNGFTDLETVVIQIDPAATGIEVLNALTGIDETESAVTGITTNDEGADESHNNLPPYFAALYVIKYY